jgi:hypothetical protein
MTGSATKDDVSNDELIDDVVPGPITTPDQEANVAPMTREQYAAAQEQWAKMVKANEELIAQAKVSADLLISVRKESANHAIAAKIAMEQQREMGGMSYVGVKNFPNLLVAKNLRKDSYMLKQQKGQRLMKNLCLFHKNLMIHQGRNLFIIQTAMMFHMVQSMIITLMTMMAHQKGNMVVTQETKAICFMFHIRWC